MKKISQGSRSQGVCENDERKPDLGDVFFFKIYDWIAYFINPPELLPAILFTKSSRGIMKFSEGSI